MGQGQEPRLGDAVITLRGIGILCRSIVGGGDDRETLSDANPPTLGYQHALQDAVDRGGQSFDGLGGLNLDALNVDVGGRRARVI